MPPARPAMQSEKSPHGFLAGVEIHRHACFFRLAHAPPHRAFHALEQLFQANSKFNAVTVKRQRGPGPLPCGIQTAAFHELPAPLPAIVHGPFIKLPFAAARGLERRTKIRERERHPTPPGQPTGYFHHRQHACQLPALKEGEVIRLVSVSVPQDPRPSAAVKNRALRMRRHLGIPVRTLHRIQCPDLQKFAFGRRGRGNWRGQCHYLRQPLRGFLPLTHALSSAATD